MLCIDWFYLRRMIEIFPRARFILFDNKDMLKCVSRTINVTTPGCIDDKEDFFIYAPLNTKIALKCEQKQVIFRLFRRSCLRATEGPRDTLPQIRRALMDHFRYIKILTWLRGLGE